MSRYAVIGLLLGWLTQPASAHDYWLQPQRFYLAPGDRTPVQLFVGDKFESEAERPFQAKLTVSLQLFSENAVRDLKPAARNGKKPVCVIAPQRAGNHLIAMERDWSHIEIKAAKFNDYLRHEGLTEILEARRKAGEDKQVGRERYRRYLKAVVQVGGKSDETYSKKLGQRLEILPKTDPGAARPGDRLTVSVFFEGRPLQRAQVAAYNRRSGTTNKQEVRTDEKGQARFEINRSGLWLIRLVHMQRCKNVPKIDWESFWAAYTFQVK